MVVTTTGGAAFWSAVGRDGIDTIGRGTARAAGGLEVLD